MRKVAMDASNEKLKIRDRMRRLVHATLEREVRHAVLDEVRGETALAVSSSVWRNVCMPLYAHVIRTDLRRDDARD